MIKTTRTSRIDTVFVLIIFCVFAISVLMVLMLSADIYKKMTDISREGYDNRTGLSYIWTKVKNNDENGSVYIGDFYGLPALCFDEEFDSVTYRTAVYYYNGWIYELFSEVGVDFLPEDGSQIIRVDELKLEGLDDGLIKATSGGKSIYISPRSKTAETNPYAALNEGGYSG